MIQICRHQVHREELEAAPAQNERTGDVIDDGHTRGDCAASDAAAPEHRRDVGVSSHQRAPVSRHGVLRERKPRAAAEHAPERLPAGGHRAEVLPGHDQRHRVPAQTVDRPPRHQVSELRHRPARLREAVRSGDSTSLPARRRAVGRRRRRRRRRHGVGRLPVTGSARGQAVRPARRRLVGDGGRAVRHAHQQNAVRQGHFRRHADAHAQGCRPEWRRVVAAAVERSDVWPQTHAALRRRGTVQSQPHQELPVVQRRRHASLHRQLPSGAIPAEAEGGQHRTAPEGGAQHLIMISWATSGTNCACAVRTVFTRRAPSTGTQAFSAGRRDL